MNIVLLGPPGAGKGTQAERLCEHFSLPHVATGDLFREHLSNNSDLGQLAKTYMDRGELVPDGVTGEMVRERLAHPDVQSGVVLDGFPRTLPQARVLTDLLADLGQQLDVVLYLNVADEILIERLCGRLICQSCQYSFHQTFNPFQTCPYDRCAGEYLFQRRDDQLEVVQTRLRTFRQETIPLIAHYAKQGLLIEIDGTQDIQVVTDESIVAVNEAVTAL